MKNKYIFFLKKISLLSLSFTCCCQLWTRCVTIWSFSPFGIDLRAFEMIISIALIVLNRKQPFISSLLTHPPQN